MANIMIVDDSRTSRKVLREILVRNGHVVVGEATNGEEGYLMYKELKPEIVTMDITMPVMDGIESLSLIKHANADAKVVMITAAGQKEKMVEALKNSDADSIFSASIVKLSGSISTNTGLQRCHKMLLVVATYENGVVIISPSFISSAANANCNAIVPLVT